jgi:dTDP-4-amino-4,6-dideoxygalactose transaminase
VPLLVPDLPTADDLLPLLLRIDAARWYTNFGPLVREFEQQLASRLSERGGDTHCVSVTSGTAALEIALSALELPSGARVLLPAFTFPATAIAVIRAGYRPVLCDVDPAHWTLSPQRAEQLWREARTERPARAASRFDAVVPVAAFGSPLDTGGWDSFCSRTGLPVVIDGAGALEMLRPGAHVSIAYSLHATKPLGIGEGGLIATRDQALAERSRRLANFGFAGGTIERPGTNAKLSEYAAAVGIAQLRRAGSLAARRAALWAEYRSALDAIPGIGLQQGFGAATPVNVVVHLGVEASQCAAALMQAGIQSRRWYCPPLHRHPAFARLPRAEPLPVVDDLAMHSLGLPFHTRLESGQIQRVADVLRSALAAAGDRLGTTRRVATTSSSGTR